MTRKRNLVVPPSDLRSTIISSQPADSDCDPKIITKAHVFFEIDFFPKICQNKLEALHQHVLEKGGYFTMLCQGGHSIKDQSIKSKHMYWVRIIAGFILNIGKIGEVSTFVQSLISFMSIQTFIRHFIGLIIYLLH